MKKIESMTDTELLKMARILPALTYVLAGVLLVLFVACTFLIVMGGMSLLIIAPLGLTPLLLFNFSRVNQLKQELQKRGLKAGGAPKPA